MKYAIAICAVAVLAGSALAHDEKGEKKPDVTMQGEVLDLACYADHGGAGAKHAQCAMGCLKDGAPAGLLTKDGKVFVLVNSHEAMDAYKSLAGLGGKAAKVTGHVSNKGGLQALIVEKVEAGK